MSMTTQTDITLSGTADVPLTIRTIRYSPRLVRTIHYLPEGYATVKSGKVDFYDTLKATALITMKARASGEIRDGQFLTPSDSNEAHHIYVKKSPGKERLRDVDEFRDHFDNNDEDWYAWEETLTGLRFRKTDLRKPYRVGDKITAERIETEIPLDILVQIADPKFMHDNFRDIIGKINKVAGTVDVPYARGHVIREMRDGIFTEVELTTEHGAPYALHGWLRGNLNIPQDTISGQYDVAVGRGCGWLRGEDEGCLGVGADFGRSDADSDGGFRPVVRGSVSGMEQK